MSRRFFKRKAYNDEHHHNLALEDNHNKRMKLSGNNRVGETDNSTRNEATRLINFLGGVQRNAIAKPVGDPTAKAAPQGSTTKNKEHPPSKHSVKANVVSKQSMPKREAPKQKPQSKSHKETKGGAADLPPKLKQSPVLKSHPKPSMVHSKKELPGSPSAKKISASEDFSKPVASKQTEASRIRDGQLEYELQRQIMLSQAQAQAQAAQQDSISVQDLYYLSMLQQQQQQQQQQHSFSDYLQLLSAGAGAGAGATAGAGASENVLLQAAMMQQKEQGRPDTDLLHRLSGLEQGAITPEIEQLLYRQMLMSGSAHDPYGYAMGGNAPGYGYSM